MAAVDELVQAKVAAVVDVLGDPPAEGVVAVLDRLWKTCDAK
jgi:hypothetical protein